MNSLTSLPNDTQTGKSQSSRPAAERQEEGTMSDESMFDAFIFNVKQITNHPSLLVDHYIPRNLLLLNSKENIISLSNKYYQVSEILDKLVQRDVRKTIIISVSNAKEMDLIESFLLGKRGLQYYRFSGSSLYYDNHGSFDFHKEEIESVTEKSSSPSSSETSNTNENLKKKSSVKSKKNSNSSNLYDSQDDSTPGLKSNNGNTVSNSNDKREKKKKKKSGRPSSAEKRAREQQAQVTAAIAAVTSSDQKSTDKDGTPSHKVRDNKEEYVPRLSKHNEEFCKMLIEKKSKKLNVYLILSSQLKYLLQFEDLKSDLILSLDSNFTDFEEVSNILHHQVPILKPVVLESLEHYEWELNNDEQAIFSDTSKRNKQRRSRSAALGATGNNNNGVDSETVSLSNINGNFKGKTSDEKARFNRLLALSVIAAWPEVEVESPFTIQSVSDKVIDWLVDPEKYTYPFNPAIETKIPHVLDDTLIDGVKATLSSPFELSTILGLHKLDKYTFFDEKLEKGKKIVEEDEGMTKVKQEIQHSVKRMKLSSNESNCTIPDNFTYRQYQSHLTNLITETLEAMLSWMNNIRRQLEFVHLDETERQYVIDRGNFDCGELYKKDRDLGVKIEARNKVKSRLIAECEKFELIASSDKDGQLGLKERYDLYSSKAIEKLPDTKKQDDEIQELKKKLSELQVTLDKCDAESLSIRQKYQETSSRAAELSAVTKRLQEEGKRLEDESKGLFKKIQVESIVEKQAYVNKRVKEMENDCLVWNGYLKALQVELEKRGSGVAATSRTSRASRNNTPH